MIALDAVPDGLRVTTPYDAAFLNEFKLVVPHAARAWQKPCWIVDPQYGAAVARLIQQHFGVSIGVPVALVTAQPEIRTIELRYIGRCKDRGDGTSTALGTMDGTNWTVILPENTLRAWFGAEDQKQDGAATLYTILACPQTVSADDLKRAYRRMARQWHPDVCREPDATQRFQAIGHAYAILSDPLKKRKYDAGLALENSTRVPAQGPRNTDYRAPLRCGLVLCEGVPKLGRFLVSRIMAWEDVVRDGKTMVSSWNIEKEAIEISWI